MGALLITGGAGFIGSNFLRFLLEKNALLKSGADNPSLADSFDTVINLDSLSYAGNLENLKGIEKHKNYHFIQGDICDTALVERIFKDYNVTSVIHFAAESHVDNSISTPEVFVKTNIYGTWNLLNCAYKHWLDSPFCHKKGYENALFHHISTDEVYGTLGKTGKFSESTPYQPNSPYSASKASSDMIVRSYAHTFGLNAVITNCSNNYGMHQHDEKLIPTIIRNALAGKEIPIYGDGKNVRDWLFVEDHCDAICVVFEYAKNQIMTLDSNGGGGLLNENPLSKNKSSQNQRNTKSQKQQIFDENKVFFECFNIGGNEERENLNIAETICAYLDEKMPKKDSYAKQIRFVQDRAGHDRRYAIDSSKLQKTLGWKPKHTFESGIAKTIEWYIKKYTTHKE